jgi:hypothetical protein
MALDKWFSPFIFNWLDMLCSKTVEWVTNAVRADSFQITETYMISLADIQDSEFVNSSTSENMSSDTSSSNLIMNSNPPPCSSSATDLFTAIYSELRVLLDLEWDNKIQRSGFFLKFAQVS